MNLSPGHASKMVLLAARACGSLLAAIFLPLALLASSPARAARPISNYPVELGSRIDAAPAVLDLDGDGHRELLVAAGRELHLLGAQGQSREGFPVMADADLLGAPAAITLGQGRAAILVISALGTVYALSASGEALPGFPLKGTGKPSGGGLFFDVDGDGVPEVVFATRSGRLHVVRLLGKKAGRSLGGFPVRFPVELSSPPAVADLGRARAQRVLLVGGTDGVLHAATFSGEIVSTFLPSSRYEIRASAVSADLDGDGPAEVVFGSGDFKLYLVDRKGVLRDGFPVSTGYRIRSAPALGDLDGDGRLEIVFSSADSKVYAIDRLGRALPGFPFLVPGKLVGGAVIGDLVGDLRPEIVVVTRQGELVVLSSQGKRLTGWEAQVGGEVSATPALGDLDGNGELEIAIGTKAGRVTLLTGRGAKKGRSVWGNEAHGVARSGWRHPTPSRFVDLSMTPSTPTTLDALLAHYTYLDLDRRPLRRLSLTWSKDGEPVEAYAGAGKVPAEATRKGEVWRFHLRDLADGEDARIFDGPAVTIRNTPPTAPGVILEPKVLRAGEAITARIVAQAGDVDQEPLTYRYRWWRDGEAVKLPLDASVVPGKKVHKGERWSVEVRAHDTSTRSEPGRAVLQAINTPPPTVPITLEPSSPGVTDKITVVARIPPKDLDGDPLHPRYSWTLDGTVLARPSRDGVLPAGIVAKGQKVGVKLTLDDGESQGVPTTAEITIANTPPSAPAIEIIPEAPHTGDALRVRITRPALDPDGDPVRYRIRWKLATQTPALSGPEVPGARVKAGQRWSVEVKAWDGEVEGLLARVSVTVKNSPPRPPVVRVVPAEPLPTQALSTEVVVPSSDRDGDAIVLRFAWEREGKRVLRGETLPEGKTRRGERWTLVATPFDGKIEGPAGRASVVIGNRAPAVPAVRLLPEKPLAQAPLRAKVTLAGDPDGDPVKPRLRWLLDGAEVVDLEDAMEVPPGRLAHFQSWEVVVRADDGALRSAPARASVRIGDRSPRPLPTRVLPPAPTTREALRCEARKKPSDPDSDPTTVRYQWLRGGKATSWEGSALPPEATRKGEVWACRATVSALERSRRGKVSASVTIVNARPTGGKVAIEPAAPRTADALHCVVAEPFTDLDRDRLITRTRWWRDGKLTRISSITIPGARTRRGETWACEVSVFDGETSSEPARAQVTLGNTPPSAPTVRLVPGEPTPDRPLRCEIVERGQDPDGDRLTFRFRWYLEGKLQPFAATSVAVPVRLLKAGQSWQCGVAGFDGSQEGEEGRSTRRRISPPKGDSR